MGAPSNFMSFITFGISCRKVRPSERWKRSSRTSPDVHSRSFTITVLGAVGADQQTGRCGTPQPPHKRIHASREREREREEYSPSCPWRASSAA